MAPRILFLTISDRKGASARYRVHQFRQVLETAGFHLDIRPPAPLPRGARRVLARRGEECRFLAAAAETDLVFIQKRLFSVAFLRRLASLGKPIVFDYDDALFTSQRGARSSFAQRRVRRRLHEVMRRASRVLAGNSYLADYARPRAARVEILPTAVPLDRYPQKRHDASAQIVLGWIGSRVTEVHLDELREMLPGLRDRLPGTEVSLLVISDRDYEVPGLPVVNRRWSEESELADLLEADIGLMPLEDSPWTRGKCGLKALQYMAAGIPAVCSPVGVNCDLVTHGETGFLCRLDSDWIERIAELAAHPALRRRLGEAGRRRVADRYSVETVGTEFVSHLRSCLDRTR